MEEMRKRINAYSKAPGNHPGGEYFWQCLRHSRVRRTLLQSDLAVSCQEPTVVSPQQGGSR
ncbi:hypothetical protein BLA13014_07548 [Burkholderia aenigmatica]|uniref:Uncharacterized protein n=1 Tax=Burkholderia aenigmatica TaxID=2015348 RepID=A0A6P2SLY7_9BURK|nr:hypothetical protein BLA13014_07548 [Burkholderia aenigmatica]